MVEVGFGKGFWCGKLCFMNLEVNESVVEKMNEGYS